MPRRHQIAGHFNQKEWEKIKAAQGDKSEYRLIREAVLKYVEPIKPEPGSSIKSVGTEQKGNRSENDGNAPVNGEQTDIW